MPENMLPSSTRGSREDQRGKGQRVSPRLDVSVANHISQGRDEAPGPGIPCTLGDRGTNPPVTGKNLPHTRSPLSQRARRVRDPILTRREGLEARGAAAVKAEAKQSLTDLASTEAISSKPVHEDVTDKLSREVCVDVGAHGAEGCPPMRREGVMRTEGDRTNKPSTETRKRGAGGLTREGEGRGLRGRTTAKRSGASLAGGAANSGAGTGEGAAPRRAGQGGVRGRASRDIGVGSRGWRHRRIGDWERPGQLRRENVRRGNKILVLRMS